MDLNRPGSGIGHMTAAWERADAARIAALHSPDAKRAAKRSRKLESAEEQERRAERAGRLTVEQTLEGIEE